MRQLFLLLFYFCYSTKADGYYDKDGNFFYKNIDFMAPEDRISNGKTAELGQFPYHAKLDLQDSNGKFFRCGGSLIASEWIVTAGHCIKG